MMGGHSASEFVPISPFQISYTHHEYPPISPDNCCHSPIIKAGPIKRFEEQLREMEARNDRHVEIFNLPSNDVFQDQRKQAY